MAKDKIMYVCEHCGQESARWLGKCPSCHQWSTFREIRVSDEKSTPTTTAAAAAQSQRQRRTAPAAHSGSDRAIALREVPATAAPRLDMGDEELNRVLGGGLVPGSVVLLGGEPGIGKSTLLLQTMLRLRGQKVLYVSGEESAHQIKMRADRIVASTTAAASTIPAELILYCDTSLENIFEHVQEVAPDLLIVDSIQTIATSTVESTAGSITQVRECAAALLHFAKASGTPVIIVGHINKDGNLAGPKVLEHIVDAVLQFEGDQHYMYRLLRSIKNRFGSTAEIGIYEMQSDGLRQVANPSELLLTADREDLAGIAISATIEGIRPFLVEAQALVSTAAYGTPQRAATGIDYRRLNMLLAVLEKRVGFKLIQKDVFVNIAGGLRVSDPAIDLSILAAVLSSNVDKPLAATWCMTGEVGLSGEVRAVSRIEQRVSEAQRLGFTDIIIPRANSSTLTAKHFSIRLHPVRKVEEALRLLLA